MEDREAPLGIVPPPTPGFFLGNNLSNRNSVMSGSVGRHCNSLRRNSKKDYIDGIEV